MRMGNLTCGDSLLEKVQTKLLPFNYGIAMLYGERMIRAPLILRPWTHGHDCMNLPTSSEWARSAAELNHSLKFREKTTDANLIDLGDSAP